MYGSEDHRHTSRTLADCRWWKQMMSCGGGGLGLKIDPKIQSVDLRSLIHVRCFLCFCFFFQFFFSQISWFFKEWGLKYLMQQRHNSTNTEFGSQITVAATNICCFLLEFVVVVVVAFQNFTISWIVTHSPRSIHLNLFSSQYLYVPNIL